MSRAARRRREQLSRAFRRLPTDQSGAIILVGFINSFSVVGLNTALAVILARSVRRHGASVSVVLPVPSALA
jgi:hypothetical protein